MDTSYMAVEVKDEIDFEYLKFVFAAKLVLDIEVRFSKHIATNHNKWWLVQILNRNQVSEEVLKKWMDIKARKS